MRKVTTQQVARAIMSPAVRHGLAAVIQSQVQRHIAQGEGREGRFKPLRPLFGVWKDKKGNEKIQAGYRNNGQPLRDTGRLMRSIRAKVVNVDGGMKVVIRGEAYGAPHERGFRRPGPVLIPLTRKGARSVKDGMVNLSSGSELIPGKDYIVAKKGTTTPARPYLLPTRADMTEFGRSLFLGLKLTLGGR